MTKYINRNYNVIEKCFNFGFVQYLLTPRPAFVYMTLEFYCVSQTWWRTFQNGRSDIYEIALWV